MSSRYDDQTQPSFKTQIMFKLEMCPKDKDAPAMGFSQSHVDVCETAREFWTYLFQLYQATVVINQAFGQALW